MSAEGAGTARTSTPSGSVLSGGLVPGALIGGSGSKLLEEFNVELEGADLKRLHWEQWQLVNLELQRELRIMLDRPTTRTLAADTVALRDRFYGMWRAAEAQLRIRQQTLIESATRGDFLKAAALARSAISLRAYEQATAAVQHEVQLVVDRYRLGDLYGAQSSDTQMPYVSEETDSQNEDTALANSVDHLSGQVVAERVGALLGNADVSKISNDRDLREVSELARKLALRPNDMPSSLAKPLTRSAKSSSSDGSGLTDSALDQQTSHQTVQHGGLSDRAPRSTTTDQTDSAERRPGLAKVIPLRRGAA